MGDGVIKRYAVIFNGDTEKRHIENAERANDRLQEAGYDIRSVTGLEGLKKAMDPVRPDDDDILLIYFTGHGSGENGASIKAADGNIPIRDIFDAVNGLEFGRRIIISDQCFSGSSAKMWYSSKTLFVSPDWINRNTICDLFAPYFWESAGVILKNGGDLNGDERITLQERFAYAAEVYQAREKDALPIFLPGAEFADIELNGKEAKSKGAKVRTVRKREELEKELAGLKPGQFALVDFSAAHCPACRDYEPRLEEIAKSAQDNIIVIKTEDNDETNWMGELGITEFPTVKLYDHNGRSAIVQNRLEPFASLFDLVLSDGAALEYARSEEKERPTSASLIMFNISRNSAEPFIEEDAMFLSKRLEKGDVKAALTLKTLLEKRPDIIKDGETLLNKANDLFDRWGASRFAYMFAYGAFLKMGGRTSYKQRKDIRKKVMGLLNTAIEDYPWNADAYVLRGVLYSLEGKAQNAMDDFDRALEANPDNVDAMYHKATLLIGRKEYDRSMEIFNKAIALYPSSTYIYNNRGALKFASGDLYGAMLDYKKAHELDPKNRLASLNYHGLFAIPDRIGLSGTATVGDAKGTLTAEASWPLFYAGKKLRLGPALGIEYSAPKDLGIMGGFAFRYLNRVLLLGIDASVGYNGGGLARYSLDILFRADDFAVGPTAVFSHMFKDVKEFDTALGLVIQYNIW